MDRYILTLRTLLIQLGVLEALAGHPHALGNLLVIHFVINSITCQHDKVVLFVYLERTDIWLSINYIWVAASVLELGFRVTKRSANAKSPWQHSYGPNNELRVIFFLIVFG